MARNFVIFLVEVVEVVLEAFLEVVLQEVAEVVLDVLEVEVSTFAYAKDTAADAPRGEDEGLAARAAQP